MFKRRVLTVLLLVSLLPALTIACVALYISSGSMEKMVYDNLSSLRDSKKNAALEYISNLERQVLLMAHNPLVQTGIKAFNNAYSDIPQSSNLGQSKQEVLDFYNKEFNPSLVSSSQGISTPNMTSIIDSMSDTALILQRAYITNNPNSVGSKNNLLSSFLDIEYDQVHRKTHPYLSTVQEQFGFYDIFFISLEGDIVYSVFKEVDFGTSLVNGPYKKSGLATVYRNALSLNKGELAMTDFSLYIPSYNAPAGFISTPVHNLAGKKLVF